MSSPRRLPEQAAPGGSPGGLFRFWLPPLSVILIGIGFAILLTGFPVAAPDSIPNPKITERTNNVSPQEKEARLAPFFSPQVLFWEEKIIAWSAEKGLDPNLVATVMQIESCGDPRARSTAGAMGLFQVMPYHFQGDENPYHPRTNARRGLNYLRLAWKKGGSVKLALAGYNGGIQGAQRPPSAWPAETKRYIYWGTGIYADATAGKERSPRLDEWLASGGKGLCQRAQARLNVDG